MKELVLTCIYLELVTFLVSLWALNKYKATPLRYLPIWLGSIVFVEFFCFYYYKVGNVWLHNLLNIFEFLLLAYIFWHYLNKQNKKWLLLLVSTFSVITIVDVAFGIQNILTQPLTYVYVVAYFFLILIVAMLFYQKLRTDPFEKGMFQNLLYWFCFGVLLFYSTVLPLYTITNWVESLGELRFYLTQVLIFAILIKNIIFITGFLCCRKIYSY